MKRTQGKWDPTRRNRFFQAGMGSQAPFSHRYRPLHDNLCAVNDFASIGRPINRDSRNFQELQRMLDTGSPIFLDSGVFNLTNQHMKNHGTTMDEALQLAPEEIDGFSWLLDVYVELCTEFGDQLWGYNELDQGGMANKIRTRTMLEDEYGLAPIPVYHPLNDGWDYFDELATEYDRMCYGNVVQAMGPTRLRLLYTAFERHRQYPDLWIHFLGVTPNQWQYGLSFDSADSSSWTYAFRYPTAFRSKTMGRNWGKGVADEYLPPRASEGTEEDKTSTPSRGLAEMLWYGRMVQHWHDRLQTEFGEGYVNDRPLIERNS